MSATSSTRLTAGSDTLQVNQPKRYGATLSLEEKCEQSFFFFYYYRMEDEAVLDRGASFVKHVCDEEEVEGECALFFFFLFLFFCISLSFCPSRDGACCTFGVRLWFLRPRHVDNC